MGIKLSGKITQFLFVLFMVQACTMASTVFHKPETVKLQDNVISDGEGPRMGNNRAVPKEIHVQEYKPVIQSGNVLSRFRVPVEGKVISKFGRRGGRIHTGTDIKLHLGDTVFAAYEGVVTKACWYYGYGNLVIIKHEHALETYYGHLSTMMVQPGDQVCTGHPLGLGGRTGRATTEHLHFEIREKGEPYNAELVYDFQKMQVRDDLGNIHKLADLKRNSEKGENNSETDDLPETNTAMVFEYVIKAGDSLWNIARRFNTSVSALCEHNNLTARSVLRIGSVIKILTTASNYQ